MGPFNGSRACVISECRIVFVLQSILNMAAPMEFVSNFTPWHFVLSFTIFLCLFIVLLFVFITNYELPLEFNYRDLPSLFFLFLRGFCMMIKRRKQGVILHHETDGRSSSENKNVTGSNNDRNPNMQLEKSYHSAVRVRVRDCR